jgi:hypothetical protein
MAQQLGRFTRTEAVSDYLDSRNANGGGEGRNNNLNLGPGRNNLNRDVGFRPELTVLPASTSLQAFAATADRMYVIVAPSPFFSDIVQVTTFNFVTGQTGTTGTTTGGGGGLLGGGGGGGLF